MNFTFTTLVRRITIDMDEEKHLDTETCNTDSIKVPQNDESN